MESVHCRDFFLWALIYKLQKKKSDVWTLVNRNFWVLFAGGILAAVQVSFLTYIVGDGEIRNVAGETYVVLMMLFGSAVIVCAYLIYIGKLKKRSDRQAEQIRIFEREQKLTRDYYVQLYEKNEKTRARQHEFRHMMQTVQDLLKREKSHERLRWSIVGIIWKQSHRHAYIPRIGLWML